MKIINKNEKAVIRILWILVLLASIKSIFTDFGADNAYTMAMSYRHLNGDSLFVKMWEPHQTSIWLTDLLMLIYKFFVPSYEGVAMYLQVCGTAMFVFICIPLYRLIKYLTDNKVFAQICCMFLIIFRAKQTPFPDFSNLQIGFSICLFISLAFFCLNQNKKYLLILGAFFLCLEILAYPSTIITVIPIVIIIIMISDHKIESLCLFVGTCIIIGFSYTGYYVNKIGIEQLLEIINKVIQSDSHATVSTTGYSYWYGIICGMSWTVGSAIIAYAITVIARRKIFIPMFGLVLAISELFFLFCQKKLHIDWTTTFYFLPVILVILGIGKYKSMDEKERIVWILGLSISFSSFVGTLLLTDLGLITIVAYLVLAGIVSFIPIRYYNCSGTTFAVLMILLITIHRGLVVWGYGFNDGVWMVYEEENIVRNGPTKGIVCDYMTYYEALCNEEDFAHFTNKDDKLFVVEHWILDPTVFMYSDATISNCSVIDTPIYNEATFDYFNINPDKIPSVVAVDCWYGNLIVPADSQVMEWVNSNYSTYEDGRYWRFYRQ